MAHLPPDDWLRLVALIEQHGEKTLYAAAGYLATGDERRWRWAQRALQQAAKSVKPRRPPGRPRKPRDAAKRRPRGRPRREFDIEAVLGALRQTDGNVRAAARALGVAESTLRRTITHRGLRSIATYPAGLVEAHVRFLRAKGVTAAAATARGYSTRTRSGQHPARWLVMPIWNAQGQRLWDLQRRDDKAESSRFRRSAWTRRHDLPRSAEPTIDVPPIGRSLALDPTRRLYVVSNPRVADVACVGGLACVAVVGRNLVTYKRLALPQDAWRPFSPGGREVCIALDASVERRPEYARLELALRGALQEAGATVRVLRLPPSDTSLADLLPRFTEPQLLKLEVPSPADPDAIEREQWRARKGLSDPWGTVVDGPG